MTLRLRLILIMLALLAAGMAGGAVVTFAVVRDHLGSQLDGQLTTIGREAEARLNVQPQPAQAVNGALAMALGGVVFAEPAFIQVRDSAGAVVSTLGLDSAPPLPASLRPAAVTGGNPDGQAFANVPGRQGGATWRVRVAAFGGGTLVIGAQRTELDGLISELAAAETAVTLLGMVLITLVAVPVIRRAMRPLRDTAAAARAIDEGDLARRISPGSPRTETGQVGHAINGMLDRIETAFRQREASEQRLRRFVADAAHELRTPVATIRGYAELFRRGAAERPADLATAMRRIESEARRMGALVDDLVLLARLDHDRGLDTRPADLAALAADAVTDARITDTERPLELHAPVPVIVRGDPLRLRQVLANLLANVRQHTDPATPASVTVTAEDGEAVLKVSDCGPGMSEQDAARAFERFHRADESRARSHGGAGLGLAIVAAITEAHGGKASLTASPGEGTTVTIRLPAATGSNNKL